ncbi:Chromosome partition protein Smc [uncultured Desulfatiglans sp.]|nr:Chromosome partition protein Smc [uncultured Desulfatiglans sp.]
MRIKKLSIRGFKSFMDRVDIAFPKGISGVVGPNGCGKSNIIDAIRWCMGEQSPKQLRGLRMEDVIFNGAGDYKAFGMAEVSLLFDNEDGAVTHPAFRHDPEIAVTRRLYRSGESEYLINGAACRLKDIQELFMDTGLGNKAYSIIGQGRIGNILEQRPEETRVMLEEAAGITKFRRQAEVTGKKIELTEENLRRVEDVLGEVERQMRSLQRQAAKARRYKEISEEIARLELTLASNAYQQMLGQLEDRLQASEGLVEQEIERTAALAQADANLSALDGMRQKAETALRDRRRHYEALKEAVHRQESLQETLGSEIRMQQEMGERLLQEKEDIERRCRELALERQALERGAEEKRLAIREMEQELARRREHVKSRREAFQTLKAEFEVVREDILSRDKRRAGLSQESGYLEKTIEKIVDRRSRLETEKGELNQKMEKVMTASETRALAREAVSERLRELEDAIAGETDLLDELKQVGRRVEAEFKAAEKEWTVSQTRLGSLQTLLDNYEGYQKGVRNIMKAQDLAPHKEGRILGLVADMIDVQPRYEQAVEAVLAENLQSVIVATQEDGRQAVEYLKQEDRGRSSFVPIEDLNGENGNGRKIYPGAHPLVSFISCPEKYAPLFGTLLGRTLVVDDLETALKAWKANGKDCCFVTVEGDMVDERGVISGGRFSRVTQGLLARKREVTELKNQVDAGRARAENLKERLEQIETEVEDRRMAVETLDERRWDLRDELNELDKAVFRLSQEVDQLQRMSERVSEDLERKDKELIRHRAELEKVRAALDLCAARQAREEAAFEEKKAEVEAAAEEIDRLKEAFAQAESDDRLLQEERRGILRDIERLDAYAQEAAGRLARIDEDLAEGLEKKAGAEERRAAVARELGLAYADLREMQGWMEEKERAFQGFVEEMKAGEAAAGRIRGEIQDLRERINRLQMAHSEIRLQMQALVEKVQENFNLDLAAVFREHLQEAASKVDLENEIKEKKARRLALGEVNLVAIREYEALKERYDFIQGQRQDLIQSIDSLRAAIRKINRTSLERFRETFDQVDAKLKEIFPILFNGGEAGLKLTDEERPLDSGVLVEVKPPGKRLSHMGLLSGGEKALVAMALLFAIYMIKPSPFCLLDEVDAPLDEENVDRFNHLLLEIKRASQIIMVTHSRKSMSISDRLFGVTMEQAGISKLVSVDLERVRRH